MPQKLKSLRIHPEGSAAIAAAIAETTGRAAKKALVSFNSIQKLAFNAEKALEQLDLTLQGRAGATVLSISGNTKSQNSGKASLFLVLRRRTAGWYLEEVQERPPLEPERAGSQRLALTHAQDAASIAQLARNYAVSSKQVSAVTTPTLRVRATRVCPINDVAIRAALQAVNGGAATHAFRTYGQIEGLASCAELELQRLLLAPRDRVGATYTCVSGAAVANAYKYARAGTKVILHRRLGGWYLGEVERTTIYAQGGGRPKLTLTGEQHAVAVEQRRERYVVRDPDQLAAETARRTALATLSEIVSDAAALVATDRRALYA
ncbi:MAG: hypothetical protein V4684_09875 [Pseudomonadota bacterium]